MIFRTDIEDMTDAQDEAPMRVYLKPGLIRQAGGYPATLTFPDHPKAIEYVRSDLARPSQAGDERVARLVAVGRRQVESMCEGFCKNLPSSEFFTEDMEHDCAVCRMRAALAAAQQPALAPAADERAAMIEVIVQADDAYDRVQGGTWAGAIADALLAAGYRKADALLAERDALIHDIERAKESESALLAELEEARVRGAE